MLVGSDIPRSTLVIQRPSHEVCISTTRVGKLKEEERKPPYPWDEERTGRGGGRGVCFALALLQDGEAVGEYHRSAAWAPGYK